MNYDDYEDDLDYAYCYDQLVLEHERFFQLPKTDSATPANVEQNKAGFLTFTHFSNDNSNRNKIVTPKKGKQTPNKHPKQQKSLPNHKPKSKNISGSKVNRITPNTGKQGANQAGPFGYT